MPYHYPDKVPAVATHWNESEKRKCAGAANAVLKRGGSEEEAIFACIHAAGKAHQKAKTATYKPSPESDQKYFDRQAEAEAEFQSLATKYKNGELSAEEYKKKLKEAVVAFLIAIAVLGNDGEPLDGEGVDDLTTFTRDILVLLDQMVDFVGNPDDFSEDYIRWRAGIFSNARQVFIRYTMPRTVWLDLPAMPGVDCLGDGACGCSWEIDELSDGTVEAYWTLGATEHCGICLDYALTYNPYVIHS